MKPVQPKSPRPRVRALRVKTALQAGNDDRRGGYEITRTNWGG